MSMRTLALVAMLGPILAACEQPGDDLREPGPDGNDTDVEDPEPDDVCPDEGPPAGALTPSDCEYLPEPSGNPFAVTRWSGAATHALTRPVHGRRTRARRTPTPRSPDDGGRSSRAPPMGQATDDDGDGAEWAPRTCPTSPWSWVMTFGEDAISVLRLHLRRRQHGARHGLTVQPVSRQRQRHLVLRPPPASAGLAMGDIRRRRRRRERGHGQSSHGGHDQECWPGRSTRWTQSGGGGRARARQAVNTELELYCQRSTSESGAMLTPLPWPTSTETATMDVAPGQERSSWRATDFSRCSVQRRLRWPRLVRQRATTSVGGYWNSGHHSFAYDHGRGRHSTWSSWPGNTVYDRRRRRSTVELGSRAPGQQLGPCADDGYPAVADLLRAQRAAPAGVPEIVLTGNQFG